MSRFGGILLLLAVVCSVATAVTDSKTFKNQVSVDAAAEAELDILNAAKVALEKAKSDFDLESSSPATNAKNKMTFISGNDNRVVMSVSKDEVGSIATQAEQHVKQQLLFVQKEDAEQRAKHKEFVESEEANKAARTKKVADMRAKFNAELAKQNELWRKQVDGSDKGKEEQAEQANKQQQKKLLEELDKVKANEAQEKKDVFAEEQKTKTKAAEGAKAKLEEEQKKLDQETQKVVDRDKQGAEEVTKTQDKLKKEIEELKNKENEEDEKRNSEGNEKKQAAEKQKEEAAKQAKKQEQESKTRQEQEDKRNAQEAADKRKKEQDEKAEANNKQEQRNKQEASNKEEQRQKYNDINIAGLCTVSQSCPGGWEDRGLVGIIMYNGHYRYNPFSRGGGFNGGWTWIHPRLCCAASNLQVSNIWTFTRDCPGQAPRLVGMILNNHDYRYNAFHGGGGFNGGWTWSHPYLCQVPNNAAFRQRSGLCLVARSCPGKWQDRGLAGMIMVRSDWHRTRFGGMYQGGDFNGGWHWIHPRVCCFTG